VLSAFREDLASGVLGVHPLNDQDVGNATRLLEQTANIALRPLDALHQSARVELWSVVVFAKTANYGYEFTQTGEDETDTARRSRPFAIQQDRCWRVYQELPICT
jgi:hypothetical protein